MVSPLTDNWLISVPVFGPGWQFHYLTKPYSGVNVSDIAAQPYQTFECVDLSGENNRRPEA